MRRDVGMSGGVGMGRGRGMSGGARMSGGAGMERIVILGVVLALSACVHTNSVLLDPRASYAPVEAYDVVIYLDERDVPYEYEPIGLVHAKADDDWTDERDMIEAMREEAAKLGAHGIIVDWIKEPRVLEHIIDHLADIDIADRRGRVVAIRAVGG